MAAWRAIHSRADLSAKAEFNERLTKHDQGEL